MVWLRPRAPAGPACRAWEEESTAPVGHCHTFLVTRVIPRQGLEWPAWAHSPATSTEAAWSPHLFFSVPSAAPEHLLLAAKHQLSSALCPLPGRSLTFFSTCLNSALPSTALGNHSPPQSLHYPAVLAPFSDLLNSGLESSM